MSQPRIAVIGAGPCGLAAAKYLLAEKAFSLISVFDQRAVPGGLWNYTLEATPDPSFTIPRTHPTTLPDALIPSQTGPPEVVSPVYDLLETNIPKALMRYADRGFPEEEALFPRHDKVKEYLHEVAKGVKGLLRLQMQVREVDKLEEGKWKVRVHDIKADKDLEEEYEAVVVASGHFNDPYVPDIPGLKEFAEQFPGSVTHSKFYRRPEDYTGKKVVVVGNSASGIDLAAQISTHATTLLLSEKTPSPSPSSDPRIHPVSTISFFTTATRTATFSDGTSQDSIDAIVFCTGYFYSFPFLRILPQELGDGSHVKGLWEHLFYRADPSLVFLGIPQRIVPFPVSEAQSAVVARVLSGRLVLPSATEMEIWERELAAQVDDVRKFHELRFPKDADYLNRLHDFGETAEKREGLERQGRGMEGPRWDEKTVWVRGQVPKIKVASRELGARRAEVRTLEELGFVYPGDL